MRRRHLRVAGLALLALLSGCLAMPAAPTPPPPAPFTPAPGSPPTATSVLVPPTSPPILPTATPAPPTPTVAASSTATPVPDTTAIPTGTASSTATPVPDNTATPTSVARRATTTPTRTTTPIPQSAIRNPQSNGPPITLLADGFGSPDDLAIDPRDGTIYFGDFANGAINRVDPAGGPPVPVVRGLNEPEGIAVRPDGRLVVVEQKTNRLWLADPQTGAKTLLRQLVNTTGQDGVDGIALDPRDGRILVPDSPNGRLLALDPDGGNLRVPATGFVRPTGVAVLPDGDWLVADEFGNALIRVTPAGQKRRLVTLYQPDDVVVGPDGMAYANGLNGIIYRVDPATGAATRLLTGLILPHGLGLDPQGRVVVAEAGRNRVFRLEGNR